MNVNKAIVVGRLTQDPEMRTTPNGQTVANFTIATNTKWKDQSGQQQERTEFHNIVAWGRRGEIIGQYVTKGQELYVEGRLETRNWDDKDTGKKMYRTEIIMENFEFGAKAGGGNGGGNYNNTATPQQNQPAAEQKKDDEIPTINLDDEQDEVKIEDVPF
ncbi:MAG: single-stranded DNA-binding protein [Candidatus Moraniibacteriota bacterium]|nr:MAG: single-stranded DNA-binding protein [Candidatus Moranbacteria bacterium]